MLKKIVRLISGKDCELREQMFRTIILIGGLATIIGIAEILMVMELNPVLMLFLFLLLAAMGASLFVTFKYRKFELAAMLIGLVMVILIFPFMFCFSGGIASGAPIWMTLGILYIFIMFSGKKQAFFLLLCLIAYGFVYVATYFYPDIITPMASEAHVYIDSFFSIIVVGFVSGGILKVHMQVYEAEHEVNLAQKAELEQASDSKNVFFATMSHEIRTPINAIIGLNEMILRTGQDDEIRTYAKDIQVASKLLLNQVNDILDLSQMEMKKMKIVPVQYQTETLFRELVELVRVQAEKKKLELIVNVDQNMPSVLFGDEKRIRQVLLNLLDNAVKYTREGSVTMSVHGEALGDDEITLRVTVADTGIGIRNEDMDYIYDSFNRADEKKNVRIVGSGLGLAITKQLVDLMEGEITVDSIYTKGTIFTVILKQKVVDDTPINNISFVKSGNVDADYYHPSFEAPEARILIVDDNSMNARVAESLLKFTKVQVDVANSGAECLELTKLKYYHVILLDYMMPEMNGAETLKALRIQENGLCRDTAVIALTANALAGVQQMYLDEGFNGYVEKPILGKQLETEILKFLPAEIIEYHEKEDVLRSNDSRMQQLTRRKRKKIYITSDCACDLPGELLEKYDIKLMYLYIKTPYGRFADTREIDSDSLTQYMSRTSSNAYADSVTVEEYEEFFAETLVQAERVIHISMASRAGASYGIAVQAAKGFDHVHIIDSGQISCGQGMVVLYAAKLALEGNSAREILDKVEKIKKNVQMRAIMPGADIFYQNGRARAFGMLASRTFNLHPFVALRQNKPVMVGLLAGSLESAWKQGIHWMLRKKRKINRDVVIITHVGCSVKQLEWIQNEILKCIPFERVIIQKTSVSTACNTGLQTIGIAYYTMFPS